MPTRRFLVYVFALLGAILFYYFYIGWFAQMLIAAMIALPVLSILVSLPGMISAKMHISAPIYTAIGDTVDFEIGINAPGGLLFGKTRGEYIITNVFAENVFLNRKLKLRGSPGSEAITVVDLDKCGCLTVEVKKTWVYDLLGLIRLPKKPPEMTVTAILPVIPVPAPEDDYMQTQDAVLKAKRGGGFAEDYELREYQVGDSVTSIHWKLTSKMGKPIVKETMIPDEYEIFVTVFPGEATDKSMNYLYWLCGDLIEKDRLFSLCWRQDERTFAFAIDSRRDLDAALFKLMSAPAKSINPVKSYHGLTGMLITGGEVKYQ